ncbi:hypothetical protein [Streptomyces shenzhenensis]|nr:hypothetical protein [Streptomyces shenzhenensis]
MPIPQDEPSARDGAWHSAVPATARDGRATLDTRATDCTLA